MALENARVGCLPFQVKVREKNCCFIKYIPQIHRKGFLKEENQRCKEVMNIKFSLMFPNIGLKKTLNKHFLSKYGKK